ncbi:unnamed protein product [Closterium sp. NIES-64]|nr:unnamed protein product [Closterium sp. NIES-64]CAI6012006.1 unnamed protein product [Closterium sp. NIES-65]
MAAAARRQHSVVFIFALLLAALLPVALARNPLPDNVYIAGDDVIGSYCEVILGAPSDPFSSVDVCLKVHRHPTHRNTISHMDFVAQIEGVTSATTPSSPTISLTDSHTVTVPCSHYESEPYPYVEGSLLYRCQESLSKSDQRVIIEGFAVSPFPIVTLQVGDTPVRVTLAHSLAYF